MHYIKIVQHSKRFPCYVQPLKILPCSIVCFLWLTIVYLLRMAHGVNWFTCIRIIVVFKNIENSAHISIFYGKSLGELKFGLFFFSQHCHTGVILSAMFSYANAGHLLQNWSFWCHSEMNGSTKYDEIQFTVPNILEFFIGIALQAIIDSETCTKCTKTYILCSHRHKFRHLAQHDTPWSQFSLEPWRQESKN